MQPASVLCRGRAAPQLERLEPAPITGQLLEIMTHEGRHQVLLDQGLRSLDGWLTENRQLIREKFSEASRYTPGIFDNYVVNRFVDGIVALLHEIATNPEHEMRSRFDEATADFIRNLKESPEYAMKGRSMLADVIRHLRTETYYRTVWEDLRCRIAADIARPSSLIVGTLALNPDQLDRPLTPLRPNTRSQANLGRKPPDDIYTHALRS
jgi:uncharacterized membrane-anchored protein YjiN (DUF445 family)